jgi:hypothetical protein
MSTALCTGVQAWQHSKQYDSEWGQLPADNTTAADKVQGCSSVTAWVPVCLLIVCSTAVSLGTVFRERH